MNGRLAPHVLRNPQAMPPAIHQIDVSQGLIGLLPGRNASLAVACNLTRWALWPAPATWLHFGLLWVCVGPGCLPIFAAPQHIPYQHSHLSLQCHPHLCTYSSIATCAPIQILGLHRLRPLWWAAHLLVSRYAACSAADCRFNRSSSPMTTSNFYFEPVQPQHHFCNQWHTRTRT